MKENLTTFGEELDYFIEHNLLSKIIRSLNENKKEEILEGPITSFGNTFGNFDFHAELDKKIKEVETVQTLGEYIQDLYQEKRKEDPECLRRAGISREYKSKLVNGVIKPSKSKLLCFAIAFQLDLEGTERLLKMAGYSLAEDNNVFDMIIGFFIKKGFYSAIDIDYYLEEYDQPVIFSIA